jgi:signal transduction histidine kinase
MNKKWNIVFLLAFLFLSFLSAFSIFGWLDSVQANLTLKTFVPVVFFVFSFLGLWLLYNFSRVLFFQKKGVRGYKLRGKITSYFLFSTIGFIVIFGALMFYLIFLIESTFIERERKIADNLLEGYQLLLDKSKADFEEKLRLRLEASPGSFPISFTIWKRKLYPQKPIKRSLFTELTNYQTNVMGFFTRTNRQNEILYIGGIPGIAVVKKGLYYFGEYPQEDLKMALDNLSSNVESLSGLKKLRSYIFPVSLLSIFVLAIPILAGVFYVSLFAAKNVTEPIEEIVKGTKIIADGNLDHKVKIKTHDEIGDLAYHFNSMGSKLKVAYQEIKRMERLEAWQEMAKRLAHEVKNPLTPIKLSAERMLYAYEMKPKEFGEILQKTANTIISETKRLENLVNEFSKFARLPELKLENKNIIKTILETADFFQHAYPQFEIEKDFESPERTLRYDENQLKQVIFNLVNNAIEASEEEKFVKISTRLEEDGFVIIVADKGISIPDEIQDKIFEPYFTTKKSGSGIGLAIAERIVSEHNGKIWFESGQNGTVFFVKLPM